jgi:archaellum biogenesis ATPase FlaH
VLPNLRKVKKTRNGWSACCPAHDDRNPSLSVNEDEGKVLMYCHAGCSFVQIVQALKEIEHERTPKSESAKIIIEEPQEKISEIQKVQAENASVSQGMFIVKPANQWTEEAISKPVPQMILGELWFEGEICILFADTNVGKSILGVQIANSITRDQKIEPFDIEVNTETNKKKVLYFDFELTDQQFARRYSEQKDKKYINVYNFDENFLRVEINRECHLPSDYKSFEEYLIAGIEYELANSNVEIIIIDNLSCIKSDNENAKDAAPFMQKLKAIKDKHKVSILVLAHTPKRDNSRPLDVNDLAGSKMLSNYADSIFAIGKSQTDKNRRYIKQIKARSSEIIYDSENVCIFEIVKLNNFLAFEFRDFDNESKHLSAPTQKSRESKIADAKKLSAEGKTQREIADNLGVSLGTVNGLLKESVQFYETNKMNILNKDEHIHVNE